MDESLPLETGRRFPVPWTRGLPSPRASMRSCLLAAATLILCNSASAHGTPPVNAPFALGGLVTSPPATCCPARTGGPRQARRVRFAVVQSGRELRVFDLTHHVELGRLWLRVDETLSAVHVLADSGWIVLDAIDHRGREDELAHVVRAYPIAR
ncbi:MAG: hypothetical protein ACJ8IK_26805 [Burkholderiaceae bacterium]